MNLPKDLTKESSKKGVLKSLHEIQRRFTGSGGAGEGESIPLLDPVTDMGIATEEFMSLTNRSKDLQKKLESSTFHNAGDREERFEAYNCRVELLEKSKLIRSEAEQNQTISMKEELKKMKRVLRRLGYTSQEGVLGTKGRFSCELSTPDELVIHDNAFFELHIFIFVYMDMQIHI